MDNNPHDPQPSAPAEGAQKKKRAPVKRRPWYAYATEKVDANGLPMDEPILLAKGTWRKNVLAEAAQKLEQGQKLVLIQHGGVYGYQRVEATRLKEEQDFS